MDNIVVILPPESTSIKIEYQVKDGYPPFKIVDDHHVNFYIELKKKEADFTTYPLCLTTENRIMQLSSNSNQSGLTVDYVGLEVGSAKRVSSNMYDNASDELSKENVEDYVDFAEQISRQMVDMSPEATIDDEIIEINNDDIVNNNHSREISLHQVYKDKETLQMILSLYVIKNSFQYKVKKSCKNEYLVACLDQDCKWLLRASKNGNTNQFIV
ncbi:hypothetical protein POM88_029722 [Heracleum sosnowskyi]|uniref:Transposase MuDR plant domain-containing protein n=1 Tax=Heracleum sosnowskyi TaxID=360622 RepID=A0AAD8HVE8_9APIA|nr:hypothetical protein POM88_029722 [Heracleum sosnowskyi]